MTRIAICEDVKSEQQALQNRLEMTGLFPNPVFEVFDNGKELVDRYNVGKRYDFVFLDVEMPVMNGIETGKAISTVDKKAIIVFVTKYPGYAIEAYDCGAFGYLLKSVDDERFNSVISKAVEKYRSLHRVYTIATKTGVVTLDVSDIYYVECCRKQLYFHTSRAVHITNKTLREVYDFLAPLGFYKVHQGYIVNFEKVKEINGLDVFLENGKKVMISVRKRREVIRAYSDFAKRYL